MSDRAVSDKTGVPTPTTSSIAYTDAPSPQVPARVVAALAPFSVRWSLHFPETSGRVWLGHGYPGLLVEARDWLAVFRALKAAGFGYLRDHTAVDYPARRPRFTVVGVLVDMDKQEELIVKTRIAEGEALASLVPLWHSANWAERETFDMFGIPFEGHPDLTRIYMPEDYDGWPMRRDFPLQGHLRFRD